MTPGAMLRRWLVAAAARFAGRWCDHPAESVYADVTSGAMVLLERSPAARLGNGVKVYTRVRWCTSCGAVDRAGNGDWELPRECHRASRFPWAWQPVRAVGGYQPRATGQHPVRPPRTP